MPRKDEDTIFAGINPGIDLFAFLNNGIDTGGVVWESLLVVRRSLFLSYAHADP